MTVTPIAAPAGIGIREYKIRVARTVPLVRATYTFADSKLDFGGEMWVAEYPITDMAQQLAGAFRGWVDRVRDVGFCAQLGSPNGSTGHFGTYSATTMTIKAVAAAGARTIYVLGIGGETLLAGSFMSIGGRLHELRKDATFNEGTGDKATLDIRPRLRDALAIDDTVQLAPANITSYWQIGEPDFDMRDRPDLWRGHTLKLTEAIRLA